jgi:hypothetical protein
MDHVYSKNFKMLDFFSKHVRPRSSFDAGFQPPLISQRLCVPCVDSGNGLTRALVPYQEPIL